MTIFHRGGSFITTSNTVQPDDLCIQGRFKACKFNNCQSFRSYNSKVWHFQTFMFPLNESLHWLDMYCNLCAITIIMKVWLKFPPILIFKGKHFRKIINKQLWSIIIYQFIYVCLWLSCPGQALQMWALPIPSAGAAVELYKEKLGGWSK